MASQWIGRGPFSGEFGSGFSWGNHAPAALLYGNMSGPGAGQLFEPVFVPESPAHQMQELKAEVSMLVQRLEGYSTLQSELMQLQSEKVELRQQIQKMTEENRKLLQEIFWLRTEDALPFDWRYDSTPWGFSPN